MRIAAVPLLTISLVLVTSSPQSGASPQRDRSHDTVTTASSLLPSTTTRLVDRARFGAFVDGMTGDPSRLTATERLLRAPIRVASYFYGFGALFPSTLERTFAAGGRRDVLLSWDMGRSRFTEWSRGRHDAYLRRIGVLAAAYRSPVYVRPWPEMNGDWAPFQPTPAGDRPAGGTPAQFVAAWRHVVTTVRSAGGTNIRWVFSPDAATYPGTTDIRTIWPGAAYVDVLGLDGYNWGQDSGWGRWRSFTEIFAAQYLRLTRLHRTAPVWICEFASKEPAYDDGAPADPAHDKGTWVTQALSTTAFPRITVMSWFDIKKERDWRIASSPSSAAAFSRLLASRTASAAHRLRATP